MSKQELFNKTLEAKKSMQLALDHIQATKHNDGEYERGMRNAFSDCARWIDELYSETDEPKLIKVKPFVADWYEKNKHALDLAIFTEIRLLDDEEWPHDSEFKSWLDQAENKPIETLIRMKDGYEVEKEPVWVVENENGYRLHSIVASPGNSLNWSFDSKNKNYIEFEEFETAKKAAYLVTGNVTEIKM